MIDLSEVKFATFVSSYEDPFLMGVLQGVLQIRCAENLDLKHALFEEDARQRIKLGLWRIAYPPELISAISELAVFAKMNAHPAHADRISELVDEISGMLRPNLDQEQNKS